MAATSAAPAQAGGDAPAPAQRKSAANISTVAGLAAWRNGVTVVARVVEGCKRVIKSKLRAPMGAKELLPPDGAPEPRHQWYAVVADGTAAISVVLTMGGETHRRAASARLARFHAQARGSRRRAPGKRRPCTCPTPAPPPAARCRAAASPLASQF